MEQLFVTEYAGKLLIKHRNHYDDGCKIKAVELVNVVVQR